jgi:DNA invertase Pin-like site-specific DNA recombinase
MPQADKLTVGDEMAVYGYARVSTLRQAEEGESLGVQRRQIEGYAKMLGLAEPQLFFEEGVSGSKPLSVRPAAKQLLAALKPGDVIIAAKLDRMFRSALDALENLNELKEKGVSLHLIDLGGDVTGNGISKLVFTILSAVAESERDRIRGRVQETKADQRKRGRHLGGYRPFGYRVEKAEGDLRGGQLVPDEREQAAIVKMKALRAEGKALRAIAAAMKEEGFSISHEGVAEVLKREG